MMFRRNANQGMQSRVVSTCLALLALLIVLSASATAHDTSGALPEDALKVYFFDVGQGDATLFQGPDFTILIDAGRHDRRDVVPHLRSVGVESIDLLIGTHPHSDHIGQFPQVIEAFSVREVWLPGTLHTTLTFERAIDAILASDAAYHEPRAGERYQFGSARVQVVNPHELTQEMNEDSVGVRILFGDVAFLLTGDAEASTEAEILARGDLLVSHILQLGHHGSRTSSTPSFLEAVQPEVAIYSAADGNTYGHPHPEIVRRLSEMKVPVYGTDTHGTIRIETDGKTYKVYTEKSLPRSSCAADQVNINAAPPERLVAIQHIGPSRADELIDLRPFNTLEELARISGIGPARVRDIIEEGVACVGERVR